MIKKLIFLATSFVLLVSCGTDKGGGSKTAENLDPKISKLKLQPGFKAELLYSPGEEGTGLMGIHGF